MRTTVTLDDELLPAVSHPEIRSFVESRRLWGRGLGAVDGHLVASVLVSAGGRLWTRDKRLWTAAVEVDADVVDWA